MEPLCLSTPTGLKPALQTTEEPLCLSTPTGLKPALQNTQVHLDTLITNKTKSSSKINQKISLTTQIMIINSLINTNNEFILVLYHKDV